METLGFIECQLAIQVYICNGFTQDDELMYSGQAEQRLQFRFQIVRR